MDLPGHFPVDLTIAEKSRPLFDPTLKQEKESYYDTTSAFHRFSPPRNRSPGFVVSADCLESGRVRGNRRQLRSRGTVRAFSVSGCVMATSAPSRLYWLQIGKS